MMNMTADQVNRACRLLLRTVDLEGYWTPGGPKLEAYRLLQANAIDGKGRAVAYKVVWEIYETFLGGERGIVSVAMLLDAWAELPTRFKELLLGLAAGETSTETWLTINERTSHGR